MTIPTDQDLIDVPEAPPPPRGRVVRAALVMLFALGFLFGAIGFVGFLSQLRNGELKPSANAEIGRAHV